jgi:FkbM family methyltransferase
MPGSQTKTLPTRHGPMLAISGDVYVTRSLEVYGEYCPDELALLLQIVKPGMTVVEVGANMGTHTVPLAKRCAPGLLYAFEPQQRIFQILCANLAMNDVVNAIALPDASGAETGLAALPNIHYDRTGNFGGIGVIIAETPVAGRTVRITPIDALGLTTCHLLKVDVEGWEHAVLRGDAQTIARCRPILYVENDRAELQGELISLIDGFNYRQYWHAPSLFSPQNFNGVTENVFGAVASLNMLCIPRESSDTAGGVAEIDPGNWSSPIKLSR